MAKKTSPNEKLKEKLFSKSKSVWETYSEAEKKKAFEFAEKYKRFMSENKTERQCVKTICSDLKKLGFKDIATAKKLKSGDKIFKDYKSKAALAAVIGKNNNYFNIIGAHLDSPRLDLKQAPLFEDSGLAFLKTHYYGGIKKYHWVNVPLSMHAVVTTKKGKKIEFTIGEKDNEPKFIIPDLLPHLAKDQMEKIAKKAIEGEQLNIIVGNVPIKDDKLDQKVKLAVMKHLNDKYGIVEEDFMCAEIEFVPAVGSSDIGFDRSLVSAYGQDDKSCAFSAFSALKETKNPKATVIALFADKEEIGSVGDSGAASRILENFAKELVALTGSKKMLSQVFENSNALSGDVTGAMDPNFKDVQDPLNVPLLGYGVVLTKYTGGGGKYDSNDASAEYMQKVRSILDKNKIKWQTGELGKVDEGGGGTIAMYISKYGINTVDAGPALLAMHSPQEISSKADLYETYKLFKAFWADA